MTPHSEPDDRPQHDERSQPDAALTILGIVVVSMAAMVVALQGGPGLLLEAFGVVLIALGWRLYRTQRSRRGGQ